MIFGGQPTPWTQEQTDALADHDERVRRAGGLIAYMEKHPGFRAFWARYWQFHAETGGNVSGAQVIECKAAEDAAMRDVSTNELLAALAADESSAPSPLAHEQTK